MNSNPTRLVHDLFVLHKPSVFDTESGAIGTRLLREPMLKFVTNSTQAPGIIFLVGNPDMRPCPVKTTMVVVVLWEIVGQNLAVQPIKRMKIIRPTASVRRVGTGHRAEMIREYGPVSFPEAQRFGANRFKPKAGRRGRRRFRCRILRRHSGTRN